MSGEMIALLSLAMLLVLMVLGTPIGFAMALIGFAGIALTLGWEQAALQLQLVAWESSTNFVMVALPLFILMGQLVYRLEIASDLYDCVEKWLGKLPGGLAVASVAACAGFGSLTGVSAASVATIGAMSLPEMKKAKYDMGLATGSIAAAGTLAILIPPSVIMIVYGIWTETSIGALFIAGIIPGIIMASSYMALIVVRCWINPALAPRGRDYTMSERLTSLTKLLPVAAIFILVIGGIYGGIFTPTEAAGVGCIGMVVLGLFMRRLTTTRMRDALLDTGGVTAMIFAVIIGGHLLARFLVYTDLTETVVSTISGAGLNPYVVILLLVLMYLVLGAVLDVWGMLILTVPLVFPIVVDLGFHPVWFGIFVVIMTELALITPPVGGLVYIMKNISGDVPLGTIFRGVTPFVFVTLAVVGLLVAFPEIVLWLPRVSGFPI